MGKPFAESCVQNQGPIFDVIGPLLSDTTNLLEIGSGTGQHAAYFTPKLPHLTWHTSDLPENHPGITSWVKSTELDNIRLPIELDVSDKLWPSIAADAVYSANTLHIMGWSAVVDMFDGIGRVLGSGGILLIYGPFNYGGKYTSESNQRFDRWLKQKNPDSSIKDFEAVNDLAEAAGLALIKDYEMPANNRLLHWRKT